MVDILRREWVCLWYYFTLRLRQIFPYWVLGMVLGSAISIFAKEKIHSIFGPLRNKPDGSPGNRVGDWYDVIDLDYSHAELWDYQIETLCQWASLVDGFRCDVAPLVPLDFWPRAREEVEQIRPGCLWLSESVESIFIAEECSHGMAILSG